MTFSAAGKRRRRRTLPTAACLIRFISRTSSTIVMAFTFKKRSNLPGFGLALGFTVLYLSLIVLIPLAATFLKASSLSWAQFWHIAASPRAVASYRLTFGASLIGALINLVFGVLMAWVLVRYPSA